MEEIVKEPFMKAIDAYCSISTFDLLTLEPLKEILVDQIKNLDTQGDTVVSNARHNEALQKALQAIYNIKEGLENELSGDLLSVDLNEALNFLGEISGEISNDELLGNIFSKFCIGK